MRSSIVLPACLFPVCPHPSPSPFVFCPSPPIPCLYIINFSDAQTFPWSTFLCTKISTVLPQSWSLGRNFDSAMSFETQVFCRHNFLITGNLVQSKKCLNNIYAKTSKTMLSVAQSCGFVAQHVFCHLLRFTR